jgi:rhomboid protease GluP
MQPVPQLSTASEPSEQPESAPSGQLPRPTATYILLAIIVGIYVIQFVLYQTQNLKPYSDPFFQLGALSYTRVTANGEFYRLLTSMFLHLSQTHILFNGFSLFYLGRFVEIYYGQRRFLIIYFLGGLSGGIASLLLTRGISAGASGAIFALFGAEMVFLWRNRELLGKQAMKELQNAVIIAVINLGIGFTSTLVPGGPGIDNWAHLGGLAAGAGLAWLIGPLLQWVSIPNDPTHQRVQDVNPLAHTWRIPLLFGLVLAIIIAVAIFVLR